MKLYLEPQFTRPDKADGGIRRVVTAQRKYLPEFGIELVSEIEQADITAGHVDHTPIKQDAPFVSHCHGLMWSDYDWDDSVRGVNESVTQSLKIAQAITAPSHWVAHALTYGLLRIPHVIHHGIDLAEWKVAQEPGNYVLWNKARADLVSDPNDMHQVARRLPNIRFVSTVGDIASNVKIIGTQKYSEHRKTIQQAGVYLATARETFGIGTLEALASGVPVAGWDYGGQSEIILQGETGYLAPYGDYNALADCVQKCLTERKRLSENARADAIKRWQWRDKIEQYANLYKQVYSEWNQPRPKVSVIVPSHNLDRFLLDAIRSLQNQTMKDFECIIVDDASQDDTPKLWQVLFDEGIDKRFQYYRTPENLKLSRALNFGFAHARGKYIINLDADNILPEDALEILSNALDIHRDLHIVYGGLDTISDDGSNRQVNAFPTSQFSWYGQIAHLNQLPSSAMVRREVRELSGGYRERQWRAEDAEFWTRVSSFGFNIARVTDKPTLIYRWRENSKSFIERRENDDIDGDWCEYFPWRTAKSGTDGHAVMQKNPRAVMNPGLVPFGAQGKRTDKYFWDVYHHQNPLVSVIIPVGNGHKRYVIDALDSLIGQTMREWEAIVINDTDEEWDKVEGAPYARVICNPGKHGAGIARNIGLDHAKAPLVYFLDADDMIRPDALAKLCQVYARSDSGYIYSDVLLPESHNTSKIVAAQDYNQLSWVHNGLHTQAMLMATEHAKQIRFDESLEAWEDWDFVVRCAINGVCGVHYPEPLLIYRKHLGKRSEHGVVIQDHLKNVLREKYNEYATGAKPMTPCGGCGSKAQQALVKSKVMETKVESLDKPLQPGFMRLRYTGARTAPVTYYANRHGYQAANTPKWRLIDVPFADADVLKGMGCFVEVMKSPTPVIESKPIATPKPVAPVAIAAPIAKPVVTEDAMQQAIAAMERETGQTIQPAIVDNRIVAVETKTEKPRRAYRKKTK